MIKIGIVDDHAIVREGFKKLIAFEKNLTTVAEYESYSEAVSGLPKQSIDILLVDIQLATHSGIELIEFVHNNYPHILIIAISMYDNEPYISSAMEKGSSGYVSKRAAADELIIAIKHVSNGLEYLSQDILKNRDAHNYKSNYLDTLTSREFEVFKLLGIGHSTKSLAVELNIQPKTVHVHKANLFKKLKVNSKKELLSLALKENILTIDDLIM